MTRFLMTLCFLSLLTAFAKPLEDSTTRSSPSASGDIHMGSDAVKSGTDIDDTDIQAQEIRRNQMDENQTAPESDETLQNDDQQELKTN